MKGWSGTGATRQNTPLLMTMLVPFVMGWPRSLLPRNSLPPPSAVCPRRRSTSQSAPAHAGAAWRRTTLSWAAFAAPTVAPAAAAARRRPRTIREAVAVAPRPVPCWADGDARGCRTAPVQPSPPPSSSAPPPPPSAPPPPGRPAAPPEHGAAARSGPPPNSRRRLRRGRQTSRPRPKLARARTTPPLFRCEHAPPPPAPPPLARLLVCDGVPSLERRPTVNQTERRVSRLRWPGAPWCRHPPREGTTALRQQAVGLLPPQHGALLFSLDGVCGAS